MRDIKFRAWYNGDMYENCAVVDGKALRRGHFATDLFSEFSEIANVMQFTGLHDRNGVEIYEGDIVRCNNGHVGAIEWEHHDCCFNVDGYYSGCDDYPTMAFIEGQPFEVIGNIHQNPELLK